MSYFQNDGDDDMSLADIMSLKITASPTDDKKVIFGSIIILITMFGVSMLFLCKFIFNI